MQGTAASAMQRKQQQPPLLPAPQRPGAAAAAALAPFDAQEVVAAFVADESRMQMELPLGLSAEQRKQAKRLADQHPGLQCESYGFGADRRLHLFKTCAGEERLRVKNTFIDDWAGQEPANDEEPLICRSLPTGLAAGTYKARAEKETVCFSPVALSTVVEGSPRSTLGDETTRRNLSSEYSGSHSGDCRSQKLSFGALSATGEPKAPEASFSAFAAGAELRPGAAVVVEGLSKLPVFNGQPGIVQSYDMETGRYAVLLDSPVAVGSTLHRLAKVKIDNLIPKQLAGAALEQGTQDQNQKLQQKLQEPPAPQASAPGAPTLLARQGVLSTGARMMCGGGPVGGGAEAEASTTEPWTTQPIRLHGLV